MQFPVKQIQLHVAAGRAPAALTISSGRSLGARAGTIHVEFLRSIPLHRRHSMT